MFIKMLKDYSIEMSRSNAQSKFLEKHIVWLFVKYRIFSLFLFLKGQIVKQKQPRSIQGAWELLQSIVAPHTII